MKVLPKRRKRELTNKWVLFGQSGTTLLALVDPKNWVLKPNTYFVSEDFVKANLLSLNDITKQCDGRTRVLMMA
jgi:hypothetical protein